MPEVAAIEAGDPLAYLERATAAAARGRLGAGGERRRHGRAAPPVDVIGREEIGGYDVARLAVERRARRSTRWLDENGYALPDGAEPILADYVDPPGLAVRRDPPRARQATGG